MFKLSFKLEHHKTDKMMCAQQRIRSALAHTQPHQSSLVECTDYDSLRIHRGEGFKNQSLIQDFEGDFPWKVSLKILN